MNSDRLDRRGMAQLRCITCAVAISLALVSFAYAEETIGFLQYDTETVRLDIYNPGLESCPVVILIHGAAGIEGDRAIRYRGFATDLMNEDIIAINAGYLPSGFNKEDAANLPKTFMISGTEDKAIDTLGSLEQWFEELGKPFQARINQGFGHTVPMTLFNENWDSIVEFLANNL